MSFVSRGRTDSTRERVGKMQSAVKRYYNINKSLMSKIGGWPTQNNFIKILLATIISTSVFTQAFFGFLEVIKTWKTITQDCESLVVLLVIVISVIIYILMSFYLLIPVTPLILDIIKPLNESRPYKYLYDVDYGIDREAYYYPLLIYSYLTTIMTMSIFVVVDTSYMMFVQHACSLFAAIGHRLESITSELNSEKNNRFVKDVQVTYNKHNLADYIQYDKDDEIYHELILVLWKHQLSIEYVSFLDSSFALYSFTLLFITIIIISFLGIQILSLLNHKEEMIRYIAMCIGGFIHLFVLNYPGQRIMNHSADVFYKAYNMLWYKMSRRSTRLLSILLYRCFVPCKLTAGKLYVLSMANYASMVQACMSYFTAFSSMN